MLKLKYPMQHGVVDDWGDMEKVWSHVYQKELKAAPEEHPILLTEAPLNPRRNREKAAEIFFEKFGCPALFVSIQAVLSLYSSGRTTGVVLDSGAGVTHAVPVFEGYTIPHSITRVDVAGDEVTRHLQLLLRKAGHNFTTSAEREIVRSIKESTCFVSLNPTRDESSGDLVDAPYKLPDGNEIQVGSERFRAPEVLFNPMLIGSEADGVHECLVTAITKSDLDLRKTFYENIVLSGGSTLFRDFGSRLLHEVKAISPKDIKIRISAPPERKYSTWMGGSVLASLNTFKKMMISAAEYQEDGAEALARKCF